ncbi:PDR/VanB family oxidoreductase [Halomonas shantousis]
MEGKLTVRVRRKSLVAEAIMGLELVSVTAEPLPAFTPGAHIDVELPNGLVRQYSLLNNASQSVVYEIAVLLDPAGRGGSECAHRDIHEGDALCIGSPRNHFALVPAQRTLLFAGGIGVTPILSMADALTRSGADFTMHYCSRSPTRTAFLKRIEASAFADRVHVHFDDGDATQHLDIDAALADADEETHLYVCGPQGFMSYVIASAKRLGWSDDCIHLEYFAGTTADMAEDGSFEVELAGTGQVIRVAADQTVAEALLAGGVDVPLSCEQGICGTCAMQVVEGEPDHRDMIFSDEEHAAGKGFTPCCSRAKSPRLVLAF